LDLPNLCSFNQEPNRRITLVGGALAQNVIWAIAGIVTIGANTLLQGNILATGNAEVGANAVHNGCIYALTTVELNMATISCPGAVALPPPPTTTFAPGCTATSSPTPSAAACAPVAFENLNASIQGDDFLTFTLTETVEGERVFEKTLADLPINNPQSAAISVLASPEASVGSQTV
jgi:hypothetical protein